ncbi:hypothetical protein B0A48_08648 [Cryoendolithus antarcticus]|uniref:Uncharacterized protein n=1 Tax=Cryoendolithus antarcticus TaxID=1507870 RepID=A0A1V8T3Z6_9PEZI|nr:hypothetical protein B0A48_08648 [Cryoendolithus antarcticus]
MDCTSCGVKVQNVLGVIPGLHNPQVTFVSRTADFDLDTRIAQTDQVIPLIEKRTGFKCSRIVEGYHSLDVRMTKVTAKQLEDSGTNGLLSVVQSKGTIYRVAYDPFIIGARDLLPDECSVAPPTADTADTQSIKRLWQMSYYTAAAAILTVPVVVLAWASTPVPVHIKEIISLVLATLVQIIAVPEFYRQAIKSLVFSRVIEMDMLVVISITAAYTYSVVAFGLTEAGLQLEQKAFFETSTLLITLVLLGRLVAAFARVNAIRAVSLRSLQTDTSLLLQPDGQQIEIDSRLLHFGDIVVVRAHSRIVTDGTVVSSDSAVDESMLTGEVVPVTKRPGDAVTAGTINGEGVMHIRITRLPGANSISDIAAAVEKALTAKPRIQDLADRVASWFVPAVVAVAIIVFAIWLGVAARVRGQNGGGAVGTSITYAIAVLAISCPCALGLAVPMVLVITGGVAARQGVVIRTATATERTFKVTDVVFDKTGTLTKGDLHVAREEMLTDGYTRESALSLAKAISNDDSHPVSKATAAHLPSLSSTPVSLERVKSIPGSGIRAEQAGRIVRAGNPFWLGIDRDPVVTQLLQQGMTCFCITVDDRAVLALGLTSILRDEASAVISALHDRNITTHIVSGDHVHAVVATAQQLGIHAGNIASRRTPSEKKDYIASLQAQGKTVLFCGDGTNDAVALAQADVGAQLGSVSDVAGAVADVVLMRGLDGLLVLLHVSKRAYVRVAFNFAWSAIYNVFAILLASGVFVKVRIQPAYSGLGEVVSVLPVILAALSMLVGREKKC